MNYFTDDDDTNGHNNHYIIRDGQRLRFTLAAMDGLDPVQRAIAALDHGARVIADAEQRRIAETDAALDAHEEYLTNAWKSPERAVADKRAAEQLPMHDDHDDPREAAMAARDHYLQNAWRDGR